MQRYLMIESRDPFESADAQYYGELACALAAKGNQVTLFLVQNGVFPARQGAQAGTLAKVASAGVSILADEFSLRERGIHADRLADGVQAAPLDVVIDQLTDGAKAMWH